MKHIKERFRVEKDIERIILARWLSMTVKNLAAVQDRILSGELEPEDLNKLHAAQNVIKSIEDFLGSFRRQMNLFEKEEK